MKFKLNFVYLFVLLALVLGACSPVSTPILPSPAVNTVAPTFVPATATLTAVPPTATATVVPTNTATPLPTSTPLPTATATPELLAINTDLTITDVNKLPVITMEDITSGKLAQTELYLYNSGAVKKISDKAVPVKPDSYIVHTFSSMPWYYAWGLKSNSSEYANFSTNPESRTYAPVSINVIVIEGKKLLVFGEVYLNTDGSVSFMHYGFENVGDPYYLNQVKRTMTGEFFPLPQIYMTNAYRGSKWFVPALEPTMVKLYATGGDERLALVKEFVASGNIPDDLTKMFLLPGIDPMNIPH